LLRPKEYLSLFILALPLNVFAIVVLISIMIEDFREKNAANQYNNHLKWQKERLQISFEERLHG